MSLRLRFLLSLLAVLLLMAVPAFYAMTRVGVLRDLVLDMRLAAAQSSLAAGKLEAALSQMDRFQRVYVATAEPSAAARMYQGADEVAAAVATLRTNGHGDLVSSAGIRPARFRQTAMHLDSLVLAGRLADATAYLMDEASPLVESARASVPALALAIDRKTGEHVPIAQQSAIATASATTASVLVGVALAIALALAAARVLTSPLERLRHAMARVADGAFDVPFDLPYEQRDEIGDLSRSFRIMTRRLSELDRLKAEFVGAVSHDLKTPISVVTGYTQLIQDELGPQLNGRQRELLDSLSRQTQTLQRRVDQLLEVSRMESGRLQLGLEEINLRHFVAEVQRQYESAARMREVRLDVLVHEGVPRDIVADPDVLRSDVIDNLMANALQFTPPGGSVRLSLQPDGERVIFEIADTGPGIPQDQLERIFDRYYHNGATRKAGLGLTIARAGIENHGGRIDVQSRIGRGTRFRVTLPIRSVASAISA